MMRGRFAQAFRRCVRGTSAVEFAMIVPVLLLFMGGVVEIGRAFQVYSSVNRLTNRYASAWADFTDSTVTACQAELAQYTSTYAMQNMAPQLKITPSNTTLRMIEVSVVLGVPVPVVGCTYPLTGLVMTPTEIAAAQNMIGNGNTGVIVTVNYAHSLVFFSRVMAQFFPNGSSWTFGYTAAQRKS